MTTNIKDDLKKLPHQPGVYIMRDDEDTIMYVGKAIDLHNRVRSYFGKEVKGRGPQIAQMVRLVARFEYIVTDSELEALILENNLIKENRPRYNTLLKDDKTYPYIRVSVQEPYPRVQFSRLMKRDKARYFGPFASAQAVREAIDLINRLYGLRTCNRILPRDIDKERPCLNYHMGQCCAPCVTGAVTKAEYAARARQALSFLNGAHDETLKELREKMTQAAEELAYEEAAKYKRLIESVELIAQKQKMSDALTEERDVLAVARDEDGTQAVVQAFFVRDGKLIGREHFFMKVREADADILSDFVKQFYSGTPFIPRELMLPEPIADQALIEEWLTKRRGARVSFRIPERGQKERLMELAQENAQLVLAQDKERMKREEGRTIGAVKEIAELLQLDRIERMEAYDISNTSGFANVGSMVVYERGRPRRSDYRKFRIQSVTGPNDYASMREMLTRRFRHGLSEREALRDENEDARYGSFTRFPDLILMDGGKGQVNIALDVLRELNLDIPVCGMVKDDRHRTRGLYYQGKEAPIDPRSEAFHLITRIQDEAHRFAITYHKSLRGAAQVDSVLDEIPGVGKARRKALMRRFQSIEEIRQASVEELAKMPEIPVSQAEKIYAFFHRAETKKEGSPDGGSETDGSHGKNEIGEPDAEGQRDARDDHAGGHQPSGVAADGVL